jgi:hypothetical protein
MRPHMLSAKHMGTMVMAHLTAVVYDPPGAGLPYLAVLLYNGEVLAARAAPSFAAAEVFNATIMPELAAEAAAKQQASNKAGKGKKGRK